MEYYHNNRCRKSREGLVFLNERNIKPEIINYLDSKIQKSEIKAILSKLQCGALQLMRKNENIFKDHIRGKNLNEDQLIDWMIKEPKLIERPILINRDRAAIGRPVENFNKIID
tara:strand:+ start:1356 stop:1697 length:342 start_codon:yes stop_codon:yes gene_type:complete